MAMIRPEAEMKESGIKWIGNIPRNWKMRKINSLFENIGSGTTPNSNIEEYYQGMINWLQSGDINGTIVKSTKKHISNEIVSNTSALTVYKAPFIAIAMYGASIGNISIVDIDACTYQACCVLVKPTKDIYMQFAFWGLMAAKEELVLSSRGGGQPNISQNIIKQLRIPVPNISEQENIADYLDKTCSKIDEIIAEAKASIDEYKKLKQSVIDNATMTGIHDSEMKNTDYVWFPEMPKSWDLVLASLLFREDVRPVDANDVSLSLSQVDGLIPTDDMSERSLKSATHDNWKHVIPDDLVLNRFKGHLGVFFASKYTGMVSFHYGVYHAIRDDVYAKYYEYLFHSTTYKNIFALKSNGITVGLQNLSNGNFYSVKILHPTLDEQIEIVKYLDKRIAEIDSLLAEKESLINDLEAYKKSLIYEVVTGKRRVV